LFYRKASTKIFVGLFTLLLILGSTSFAAPGYTQTPEQTATEFYRWYVGQLNRNKDPRTQQKQKMLTFISKGLAKRVYSIPADEYDADVFIAGQDYDEEWEQAISTSKAVVKGNTATLKVTLGVTPNGKVIKSKWKHELRLKMVKEGGIWKIDRINDF
jgi:hypothetical protein